MYIHFPALPAAAGQSHRRSPPVFSSEGFLSGYHSRNHRLPESVGRPDIRLFRMEIYQYGQLRTLYSGKHRYRIGNFLIGKFHVSIINSSPLFPAKACKQYKQHQKQKQNGDFFLFAPFFHTVSSSNFVVTSVQTAKPVTSKWVQGS